MEVLASLGTLGVSRRLAEGTIDIGLSGRGLKPEEIAKGVREAACMTTALVFAANHPDQGYGIRSAELPALFRDPRPTWGDGKPLKLILRARSGSEYPYLIKVVPGMNAALDEAHQRRGIPMGATDRECRYRSADRGGAGDSVPDPGAGGKTGLAAVAAGRRRTLYRNRG